VLKTTAYNPQCDGQSEASNQKVEIAIRFHVNTCNSTWTKLLSALERQMNNNPASGIGGLSPNEVIYGFETNEGMNVSETQPPEGIARNREVNRAEAQAAIAHAQAIMKKNFDNKHVPISFKPGDLVRINIHKGLKLAGGE
jgi:hypothetical protein